MKKVKFITPYEYESKEPLPRSTKVRVQPNLAPSLESMVISYQDGGIFSGFDNPDDADDIELQDISDLSDVLPNVNHVPKRPQQLSEENDDSSEAEKKSDVNEEQEVAKE